MPQITNLCVKLPQYLSLACRCTVLTDKEKCSCSNVILGNILRSVSLFPLGAPSSKRKLSHRDGVGDETATYPKDSENAKVHILHDVVQFSLRLLSFSLHQGFTVHFSQRMWSCNPVIASHCCHTTENKK